MRTIGNTVAAVILAALPGYSFATSTAPGWLEETMYASGKINTVVAVVAAVLIGLAVWMFLMDRNVRRMEDRMKK